MRCVWCWMLCCIEKDLHLRFSRFVRNVECIKHACVYAGLAIEDWWQYEACAGISLNRIFNCGQPLVKSSLHCTPTTAIGCNEMNNSTLQSNIFVGLHNACNAGHCISNVSVQQFAPHCCCTAVALSVAKSCRDLSIQRAPSRCPCETYTALACNLMGMYSAVQSEQWYSENNAIHPVHTV